VRRPRSEFIIEVK